MEAPKSRDCAHMGMDMETLVGVDKSVLRSWVDHAHARHAWRGGFASGCPRIQDVSVEVRGRCAGQLPAWQYPLLGGPRGCGLTKVDTLERVLSVLSMEMKALCHLTPHISPLCLTNAFPILRLLGEAGVHLLILLSLASAQKNLAPHS